MTIHVSNNLLCYYAGAIKGKLGMHRLILQSLLVYWFNVRNDGT